MTPSVSVSTQCKEIIEIYIYIYGYYVETMHVWTLYYIK